MRLLVGTAVIGLAMVAGCSTGGDSATASEPTIPSTSTTTVSQSLSAPTPTPTPERSAGYVNRATWSDGPWPITVDEAVLECQGDSLVILTAGGSKYSLNAAADAQTGLPDYADAIGLPDPNKPGMHVDAGPLIQRGLMFCGTSTSPTTSTDGSNRPAGLVERQTWNDGPWPFTVDTATLFCAKAPDGERVTIVADREMYALNGTANSTHLWPPFDPIWLDNPNIPDLKVDIGPMIDRGLALCSG